MFMYCTACSTGLYCNKKINLNNFSLSLIIFHTYSLTQEAAVTILFPSYTKQLHLIHLLWKMASNQQKSKFSPFFASAPDAILEPPSFNCDSSWSIAAKHPAASADATKKVAKNFILFFSIAILLTNEFILIAKWRRSDPLYTFFDFFFSSFSNGDLPKNYRKCERKREKIAKVYSTLLIIQIANDGVWRSFNAYLCLFLLI